MQLHSFEILMTEVDRICEKNQEDYEIIKKLVLDYAKNTYSMGFVDGLRGDRTEIDGITN
jgi:hypothetical protein